MGAKLLKILQREAKFKEFLRKKAFKGKKVKKAPDALCTGGFAMSNQNLRTSFFYMLQLVTPSVVAMAVRKEIAICKIVFQVFAFIIFIIIF